MSKARTVQRISIGSAEGRFHWLLPLSAMSLMAILLGILVCCLLISLMLGSVMLTPAEILQSILGAADTPDRRVIWDFRLPRSLAAALSGMLLALSGALLQNLTRNPLADPSLIGISQGAGLAVVLFVVLLPGAAIEVRPLVAFGGAIAIAFLIRWLSTSDGDNHTLKFILMGIGIAVLLSAITSALITYGEIDLAMAALAWLSGSLHTAGWGDVRLLGLCLLLLTPLIAIYSRPLMALRLGKHMAQGLGVPVAWTEHILVCLAAICAATVVALFGPISFVGLVAPHMARRITSESDMGLHLVTSALCGAAMLVLSDLVGRVLLLPVQFPAGLVTALIGVPVLLLLMMYYTQHRQL